LIRIGLDFDNTIVNYDRVFHFLAKKKYKLSSLHNTKKEIRKKIINLKGERSWMAMQGQAYGKHMYKAEMSLGFKNFLHRAIINDSKIFIISHKTEFGHFDKSKTNLRKKSYEWIAKNINKNEKIKINKKNIFFLSSISSKINKIKELKLNYFIDDLELILNDKDFPKSTTKILYNTPTKNNSFVNYINWREISHYIFGKEQPRELVKWIEKTSNLKIKKIKKIKGQKNSQVFKVVTNKNKELLLKYYPDPKNDKVNRSENEFNSLKLIRNISTEVPKSILLNTSLNFALYEFIKGKKINKIKSDDIYNILKFIRKIQKIKNTKNTLIKNAKESCLSINDLIIQINNRYAKLLEVNIKNKNIKLKKFLHEFNSVKDNIYNLIYKNFSKKNILNKLPNHQQIIHPADFGFHNSIKSNTKIYFIDFEYLGFDDPVKLICDFYWHPAMKLDKNISKLWLHESLKVFNYKNISVKLQFLLNAYGLRWSLIILNDFVNNYQNDIQNVSDKYYNIQLKKSFHIIKRIKIEKNITR
jgi:hypothetical protein